MGSISANGALEPLRIVIVGAGIAGLAAATALGQKGHSVTVLESKPSLNEFGASIGILANGVRPLKAWGLQHEFEQVVTKNKRLNLRDGHTNEPLGYLAQNIGNYSSIYYVDEVWNINRQDYQRTLAKAAEDSGARIVFDAETASIDVDHCIVKLRNGMAVNADVIIGADGMRSIVRKSIPKTSHVEPKALKEKCFRCEVPKDKMRGNPKLEWLLDIGDEFGWLGKGRYVLAWPLPENRAFDVVTCLQQPSDLPPGKWGVRATPDEARKDFSDFCPEVVELLSHLSGAVKWTLAELPHLDTFTSETGKVVLIGDAAHAMIPHSASGGNSAIEDAACIAECLDWAWRQGRDIAVATRAYEDIRKPRVERMQAASQEGYVFLGANSDELVAMRNTALKAQTKIFDEELALPEDELRAKARAYQPNMHARFPSSEYLAWLHNYDAIQTAKEHLAKLA